MKNFFIEYLNKKKKFARDKKYFETYAEALHWGKRSLSNFHVDMIKVNS